MEFENNAFFWQKLDSLFMSGDLNLDQPKGSHHPVYQAMVYPVDYGHIRDIAGSETDQIGVYVGSDNTQQVNSIIVCADILQRDIEVKLLVGCTEQETNTILDFVNQTDFQKTVILRRGNSIPDWAHGGN